MSKTILFDEFHVTLFVSARLPSEASRAIRLALDDPRFRTALRRAIRGVLGRYPSLDRVTFTLTR